MTSTACPSSVDNGANQLLQKLYESLAQPCPNTRDYSCFVLSQKEELEDVSGITSRMTPEEREALEDHGYQDLDKFLGSGRHGRVFLAAVTRRCVKNSLRLSEVYNNKAMNVAIKIIDLDLGYEMLKKFAFILPNEIANMNHMYETDYSIKLFDSFLSYKKLFLVTELMDTNLRNAVKEERILNVTRSLKIENSRRYFFRATRAVYHLHNHNIAHRDLKPANIYMNYKHQEIKLGDFGLSFNLARLDEPNGYKYLLNICGTLPYMAPEVVKPGNGKHDPRKADMWSLGIMLFYFITGFMLFPAATIEQLIQAHISYDSETYPFSSMLPRDISQIVKSLLNKNPVKRPNADEVLRNDWFYPEYLVEQWNDVQTKDIVRRTAIKSSSEVVSESVYISEYLAERVAILNQVGRLLQPIKTNVDFSHVLTVVCVRILTLQRDNKNLYEVWRLVKENQTHISNNLVESNGVYFKPPYTLSSAFHTRRETFSVLDLAAYRQNRFDRYQPVIIIKKLPATGASKEPLSPRMNRLPSYSGGNSFPIVMYTKGMHYRPAVQEASVRYIGIPELKARQRETVNPGSLPSSAGTSKVRMLDPGKRVTKIFSTFVKPELPSASKKRRHQKRRNSTKQQVEENEEAEEEGGFISNLFDRVISVVKNYYQYDEDETQAEASQQSAIRPNPVTSGNLFTRDYLSDDSAAMSIDSEWTTQQQQQQQQQHTIQTLYYSPPSDSSHASHQSNIATFPNTVSEADEPNFTPDLRTGVRKRRKKPHRPGCCTTPDLTPPRLRSNLKLPRRKFS